MGVVLERIKMEDPINLNEVYEQVLKRHKETVFKHIQLSHHLLSHLLKHRVVTDMERKRLLYEYLQSNDSTNEAKQSFLDILIKKGYRVFERFLKALDDETEHAGHATLYSNFVKYEKIFTEPPSNGREHRSDWTDQREELVLNTGASSRVKPIENISQNMEIRFQEITGRLSGIENMISSLCTKWTSLRLSSVLFPLVLLMIATDKRPKNYYLGFPIQRM